MRLLLDHGCGRNFGDIAMLEAITLKLRHLHPSAAIRIVGNPPVSESIWNDARIEPTNCFDTTGEGYDRLHIAGGGNLNDLFETLLRQKCTLMQSFLNEGKTVTLSGQQLGPFRSKVQEEKLMQILKQVAWIGVRDTESLVLCTRYGIEPKQCELTGDDSLSLAPAAASKTISILNGYGLQQNQFLAINVRIGTYVQEHRKHLPGIGTMFEALSQKLSLPLLFVPISRNPIDDDKSAATELAKHMRTRFQVLETEHSTVSDIKGIIGAATGCIGTSWHFCTFAVTQGIPALCLHGSNYYAQKARGICSFWNDDRLAVPMEHMSEPSAIDRIAATLNDPELRTKLQKRSADAVQDWNAVMDVRLLTSS